MEASKCMSLNSSRPFEIVLEGMLGIRWVLEYIYIYIYIRVRGGGERIIDP